MAWRCSGSSNEELVQNLRNSGIINSDRIFESMKATDRKNYVLDKREAYDDSPSSIGYHATISAPHMHAHALEYLLPLIKPGGKVLDVGSGSGYLVGIFKNLVGDQGTVVGIDTIPQLIKFSRDNLERDGFSGHLQSGSIKMVCGDGRQGYPEAAPFDVIHVGAAAASMPKALIEQLNSPGRMFIPVGTYSQAVIQVDKDANGKVTQQELFGVRYVPLTDAPKSSDM